MLTIGCPGHHWLKTFLTLTPLWLTACYFQVKSEAALQAEVMQYLPEEVLAQIAVINPIGHVMEMFAISSVFIGCHYM